MAHFDFEKPIQELEDQLEEVKKVHEKGKVDMHSKMEELKLQILETKKEVYGKSQWPRLSLLCYEKPRLNNQKLKYNGADIATLTGVTTLDIATFVE